MPEPLRFALAGALPADFIQVEGPQKDLGRLMLDLLQVFAYPKV